MQCLIITPTLTTSLLLLKEITTNLQNCLTTRFSTTTTTTISNCLQFLFKNYNNNNNTNLLHLFNVLLKKQRIFLFK